MATYKAVIRKGTQYIKSDKTTNIKIRITHQGKQTYISTNYYVIPDKQWNAGEGIAKGFANAKFINERLSQMLLDYRRKDIESEDEADYLSANDIRNSLMVEKSKTIDFISFADMVIKKLETEKKTSTASWHQVLVNSLKSFIDRENLNINQIDTDFLERFEKWMLTKDKPMTAGGINVYMRSFRSLFNQAREYYNDENTGKLTILHYPFKKYSIPQVKRRMQGKSLTIAEMKKINNMVPKNKYQAWAKDMFLIMFCLIGINSKDLYYLTKSKGKRIEYDRFKTGRFYSIKPEPELNRIIKKYQDDTMFINISKNYATHKNFTKQLDKHLKKVATDCSIEKLIASNFARHTWGTIARNDCRINKDDVALCLGHEDQDNKITDTYIDYDFGIQDRTNRKVLNAIFKTTIQKQTKTIEQLPAIG
jgi:Phage integrase SAM-like domain